MKTLIEAAPVARMDLIGQRSEILAKLNADRQAIRLPLATVNELSEWLKEEFGIDHVDSLEEWWLNFKASLSRAEYKKLNRLISKRFKPTLTSRDDVAFYDFVARDPLSGFHHAGRRCFILDAAVFLNVVLEATECKGPILDVGCNTGHHAAWLARRLDVPVLGVDRSSKAIKYAKERAKGNTLCSFQHRDLTQVAAGETFDCIYSIDSLENDATAFVSQVESLASKLKTGGMLIVIHHYLDELIVNERFAQLAERHQLGYGLADFIGGYEGTNYPNPPWDFIRCAVFVKGNQQPVPQDFKFDSVSMLDDFARYANTSSDPVSEKTQAFFRARR